MTRNRIALVAVALAVGITGSLAAQMGGGQMTDHQHGSMQGSMQGMSGAMSSQQMMRNIDGMMANVTSTMRDFSSMQPGGLGVQHDQMMKSIGGLVDQMHQVHAAMGEMAGNSAMANNSDAMKAFERAGSEFEKMGKAVDSMMKNLSQTAKGMSSGHK